MRSINHLKPDYHTKYMLQSRKTEKKSKKYEIEKLENEVYIK